ncbi:MAG: exonuclease SbcC [Flavobacteriales bacterium]|jgi:exonuclease SbcC
MKPIQLTMSAFGPFAESVSIDFEALGESPLFLLNGATGAGKTSILDAICFALYGKTTGGEREGSQMRCDLAAEDLLCEVEYTFSLGSIRYRVRRLPEQARAKKSGEGFTQRKPEAQVYRIDEGGSEQLLVAAKVSDANACVEGLLGLDAEQFRQVMVLPQGKFRQLLMADSKDREKIFGQLFQTHIYKKIEERLKDSASGIRRAVHDQRNVRDDILKNSQLESKEALNDELGSVLLELSEADTKRKNDAKLKALAEKSLEGAERLVLVFLKLDSLTQEHCRLTSLQNEIELKTLQVQSASKAKMITPFLIGFELRKKEYESAQSVEDLNQGNADLAAKELYESQCEHAKIEEYDGKLIELRREQEQLVEHNKNLDELLAINHSVVEVEVKTTKLNAQVGTIQNDLIDLSSKQNGLMGELPALEHLAEQQLPAQAELNSLGKTLETFRQWQQENNHLQDSRNNLDELKARGLKLRDNSERNRLATKSLQLQWHNGQAAVLAGELKEGLSCPVCGSSEHPKPAQVDIKIPSDKDMDRAQALEKKSQHEHSDAQSQWKALNDQYVLNYERNTKLGESFSESLEGNSGESPLLNENTLLTRVNAAEVNFTKASQAKERLSSTRKQLESLRAQEVELRRAEQEFSNVLAATDAEHRALRLKQGELEGNLPESFRDKNLMVQQRKELHKKVEGQVAALESIRERYSHARQFNAEKGAALKASSEALLRAETAWCEAKQQFFERLDHSGFESKYALKKAIIDDDVREALDVEIESYKRQCIENTSAMDAIKAELKERVRPVLEPLRQVIVDANDALELSDQACQTVQARKTILSDAQKRLEDIEKSNAKLEAEYAIVGTLSDVANGQTGNKVSLQRFVLSVLLDDVLSEASIRLREMSQGRYQLLRKEERAKGNKASGLELEVEDAYTSKVRPISTLSGGESFMAALAMALGLSNVVQAYAGGIKLETLFIDEGFGSLDQQSLELAISTLIDLRASGRTIGVISHVTEMKEQIPTRIDVHKSSSGSYCRIVLP